jgi:hypothetical protein
MPRISLVLALTALAILPAGASARPTHDGPLAHTAASRGVILGGFSGQGWPVVAEMNKSGSRVVKATIALVLDCTDGRTLNQLDGYKNMTITKSGKIGVTFGPETKTNDDGTKTVSQGSISGKFNSSRSRLSGKWNLSLTDYDASGATTNSCASGSVSWSVKQ